MEKFDYSQAKVLIVDDVEEVLNSTKNCLKLQGMQVECQSNPKEALDYLKNNKVDVLLLDFFMPEMNGDEFIQELRKFDNEVVVILRTGYSDKIPPLEMIDELNIQGYIDKIKGKDELLLLTKSAIKTAFLNKEIKEKEKEIDSLHYRNEFFGKFMYRLIGEVRERTMIISGLTDAITNDTKNIPNEDLEKYSIGIKKATGKLIDIVEKLEIEKISIPTINEIQEVLNSLFEISLQMKSSKLNIQYSENYILNCDIKTIIYTLVDIIEFLLSVEEKEINILIEKENQSIIIKICNKITNNEIIEKVKKLAKLDNQIMVEKEFDQIKIIINQK